MKRFALVVSILAVIALAVIDLTYRSELKPDVVYEMANQHIEWTK